MKREVMMRGRNVEALAVVLGAIAALGVTSPAAGAEESASAAWTMPDVMDANLQDAVDAVEATAGENNVSFYLAPRPIKNQVVYNYTNWIVCYQSPSAGDAVSLGAKPKTVTLLIKRPSEGC